MRSALFGRLVATIAAICGLAVPVAVPAYTASPPAQRQPATSRAMPERVAFRGHFGFGGSRSRGYGYGYRSSRPRHTLLHSVVKTAIWLYILHLFFSHGGLSILLWIIIIGLVVSLVRRRRRYAYSGGWRR
jgi:hypothetical protein